MPGDELVGHATFLATRAITIQGTPADIWPWLVQMGYHRAGYYGYDLIENPGSRTGIRSAGTIRADLQHPQPGDLLPISAVAHMFFGSIQPNRFLIWKGAGNPSDSAFTWALYPVDADHTRLVSRIRLRYHWTDPRLALDLFTEFADPIAVPKILSGVKDRVEGRPSEPLAAQAVEIAVWLVALTECIAGAFLVLRSTRWVRPWLVSLASGGLLQVALYAHQPVWMTAVFALVLGIALYPGPASARSASSPPAL